jgi:hypothetical protein
LQEGIETHAQKQSDKSELSKDNTPENRQMDALLLSWVHAFWPDDQLWALVKGSSTETKLQVELRLTISTALLLVHADIGLDERHL